MDLKYRLYPYPVLQEGTDDYINSSFTFNLIDLSQDNNFLTMDSNLYLKIESQLDDLNLKEYLKKGDIELLAHVECSQTNYRKIFLSNKLTFNIVIDPADVNGKISICLFLIAKRDIQNFSCINFNQDYMGMNFFIEKGNIIAIGGQYNWMVAKKNQELGEVTSIFSICKNENDENIKGMNINLMNEKIIIDLPSEEYQNYQLNSHNLANMDVVNSFIIYPTLLYIFETLKKEETFEAYEEFRWFNVIKAVLVSLKLDLTKEIIDEYDSFYLAQLLMKNPIKKALKILLDQETGEGD